MRFAETLNTHGDTFALSFLENFKRIDIDCEETDAVRKLYQKIPGYKEARAYIQGNLKYLSEEAQVAKEAEAANYHGNYYLLVAQAASAVGTMVYQLKYAEVYGHLEKNPNKRPVAEPDAPAVDVEPKGQPERKRVRFR